MTVIKTMIKNENDFFMSQEKIKIINKQANK